jgi:hypothetical protein
VARLEGFRPAIDPTSDTAPDREALAAWQRLIAEHNAETIEAAALAALGYPATWSSTPGEIDRIGRTIVTKPTRFAGD